MPAKGRKKPQKFHPAVQYIERVIDFNADQDRLKQQLLQVLEGEERGRELLDNSKAVKSDGLLVSIEIIMNPNMYRFLRGALGSRFIRVPEIVTDTNFRSFVAKRIIADVWGDAEEKVVRHSLPLQYHNMREQVVNANNGLLERLFTLSTSPDAKGSFFYPVAEVEIFGMACPIAGSL